MPRGKRSLENLPDPAAVAWSSLPVLDWQHRLYDYLESLTDRVNIIVGWFPTGPGSSADSPGSSLGGFTPELVLYGSASGGIAQDTPFKYREGVDALSVMGRIGANIDVPTARLHASQHTVDAHTAPLKIDGAPADILMTVLEDGAFEYEREWYLTPEANDVPHLWFTATTAGVEQRYDLLDGLTAGGGPGITFDGHADKLALWTTATNIGHDDNLCWASSKLGVGNASPNSTVSIGDDLGTYTGITVGDTDGNTTIALGQSTTYFGGLVWMRNATPADAYLKLGTNDSSNDLALQVGGGVTYIGGKCGVNITPTSRLHCAAHTATAGTAPLEFEGSAYNVLLGTPLDGAWEYVRENHTGGEGDTLPHLYFTATTHGVDLRYDLLPSGGGPPISGSGHADKIAYWSSTTVLTHDDNLCWTSSKLGVGNASPNSTVSIGDDLGTYTGITVGDTDGNTMIALGQSTTYFGGLVWMRDATPADAYLKLGTNDPSNTLALQVSGGDTVINGKTGANVAAPSARIHSEAQTADAGTSPLKFNGSSTLLSAVEEGAFEYQPDPGNPPHLYFTAKNSAGTDTRYDLLVGAMTASITNLAGTPTQVAWWSGSTELTGDDDFFVSWAGTGGASWSKKVTYASPTERCAVSGDGKYVLAYASGRFYRSSDYGETWAYTYFGGSPPVTFGLSRDGTYQIYGTGAGGVSAYVYVSSTSGASFDTVSLSDTSYPRVALSDDGQYQIAALQNSHIHMSEDWGQTWDVDSATADSRGSAMSGNGKYVLVAVNANYMLQSSDYGRKSTYASVSGAGSRNWREVALSYTGQYQLAAVYNGSLYYSHDYGANWSEVTTTGAQDWKQLDVSANGQLQVACDISNGVWSSSDYGVTWTNTWPSVAISGLAMSNDGTVQISAYDHSGIYKSDAVGKLVVSIGNAAPLDKLSLQDTGSIKGNIDVLSIANTANGVSGMEDTRTSIRFDQWYYDATAPAVVDAARISAGTVSNWTSTASTQDAYLSFYVADDGVLTSRLKIGNDGVIELPDGGELRIYAGTSGYVGLKPAAISTSQTYTLPAADGNSGQVLSTDSSGTLSWIDASAAAGSLTGSGADTYVAYWTGTSALSGESAFTYNASTNALDVSGSVSTGFFNSDAVPGTPSAGDIWYDSTQMSLRFFKMTEVFGAVGIVHAMTSVVTKDSGTTTEQDLDSHAFAAGRLAAAGKTIRIITGGHWENTDASPESTKFNFYLGANYIGTSAISLAASEFGYWRAQIDATILTTGIGGTASVVGLFTSYDGANTICLTIGTGGSAMSIDTTGSVTVKATVDFDTGTDLTHVTQEIFTIEVLD